ncbi:lysyl-tRNA synthetase, class II [Steroidobacter denitrificans]|uniref:Lysyl-tRNA synthetase, class II n=1 Tax=Steroidobacter denitrificans TaxID=465721 RepID=A0A127FD09_STEDE|nr:EF-P lysine aminoacylase EpmA [Steroidobacter denitrificans]AMN47501.1 lysyl-tRNA synthetase, class II [Steroidobacter denitrificans]
MSDWMPTATLATLELRASMLRAAREYFTATRALEVDTPALGAAGVTDIHLANVEACANGQRRFLHTSPEYAMKRLLAAGCGDIWQACKVYRDGESGRWHNPEFTLIEWYRLGMDHHALMSDVERLLAAMLPPARALDRAERLSYQDAMQLHAGIDALQDPAPVLIARLDTAGIDVPDGLHRDRDACLDLIMATLVGPRLGLERLCFVYDYPASQAALARLRGPVASRFEAYWDGIELANGFHELAAPAEQRARIENDARERARRGLPPMPADERFLAALEHGLPECSGVALGFDRLVMCASGARHIDEVLAFPFARA